MRFSVMIRRGGWWHDNIFNEDILTGYFRKLEDATKWAAEEAAQVKGGWSVKEIVIREILDEKE